MPESVNHEMVNAVFSRMLYLWGCSDVTSLFFWGFFVFLFLFFACLFFVCLFIYFSVVVLGDIIIRTHSGVFTVRAFLLVFSANSWAVSLNLTIIQISYLPLCSYFSNDYKSNINYLAT